MSLKDEILALDDLRTEVVHVDEWDRDVTIRQLPNAEMDEFTEACLRQKEGSSVRITGLKARLVAKSVVEGGERVFSDDDVEALQGKSAGAINALFEAAQKLNNMSAEETEEALGN
jgi:hypothetical protein